MLSVGIVTKGWILTCMLLQSKISFLVSVSWFFFLLSTLLEQNNDIPKIPLLCEIKRLANYQERLWHCSRPDPLWYHSPHIIYFIPDPFETRNLKSSIPSTNEKYIPVIFLAFLLWELIVMYKIPENLGIWCSLVWCVWFRSVEWLSLLGLNNRLSRNIVQWSAKE